uniref:Uncharacterized protein n=1 Tax=Glossina austeni TaxID=7395 RepID=A0A1A9VV29_GLOAU
MGKGILSGSRPMRVCKPSSPELYALHMLVEIFCNHLSFFLRRNIGIHAIAIKTNENSRRTPSTGAPKRKKQKKKKKTKENILLKLLTPLTQSPSQVRLLSWNLKVKVRYNYDKYAILFRSTSNLSGATIPFPKHSQHHRHTIRVNLSRIKDWICNFKVLLMGKILMSKNLDKENIYDLPMPLTIVLAWLLPAFLSVAIIKRDP